MKNTVDVDRLEAVMKDFGKIYVETTKQERFTIEKGKFIGYKLTDIDPPILEKDIFEFRSMFLNEQQIRRGNTPDYSYVNIENPLIFDGIAKKGHLAFRENDYEGYTTTTGKIDRVYYKHKVGKFIFNIHMFEPAGKKIRVLDYFDRDFTIETELMPYEFKLVGENIIFEDKMLIAIYSLYSVTNAFKLIDMMEADIAEFDVSCEYLVLNKPFIIVSYDRENNRVIVSTINEKALYIE